MLIISYDISSNETRNNFSKLLFANGAIRLQYSVYELNNTKQITDKLLAKIEVFAKNFTGADSVLIFDILNSNIKKYGNAIHIDKDIVYF